MLAVLFSKNCDVEVLSWKKNSDGRVLSLLIKLNDRLVNLVSIYAPVILTDCKEFLSNLHEFFFPGANLIGGGNFNCYERSVDKFGGNVSSQKELTNFRTDFHLIGVWRKKHPREGQFTWFNCDKTIACRLDKFFVSKNISERTIACNIFPCVYSDHDFVSFNFNLSEVPARRPAICKFNNSLMQDLGFRDAIRKSINDHLRFQHAFSNIKEWWDFLKESLKEISLDFSRSARGCQPGVSLTNKLCSLNRRLECESVNEETMECETRLKALIERDLARAKVRSRAEWIEKGEKPTSFFFRLKRNGDQKHFIASILDMDDNEVTTQKDTEKVHVDFILSFTLFLRLMKTLKLLSWMVFRAFCHPLIRIVVMD